MSKILLADDDTALCQEIAAWLGVEHLVDCVADGAAALDMLGYSSYDLIIFDWDMPIMSGTDACREFRRRGGSTPILMLTGKTKVENKMEGFEAGADDYLTKPFDVRELSVRVKALTRRMPNFIGNELTVGSLSMNCATHTVMLEKKEISLQPREFQLLEYFMKHPGQPFSAEKLIQQIWSSDSDVNSEIIYAYMTKLRKKLMTANGCPIRNIRAVGYKLEV